MLFRLGQLPLEAQDVCKKILVIADVRGNGLVNPCRLDAETDFDCFARFDLGVKACSLGDPLHGRGHPVAKVGLVVQRLNARRGQALDLREVPP
jgi:hypothetical protein